MNLSKIRGFLSLIGLATAPIAMPMPVSSAGRGVNALKFYFLAVRGPRGLEFDSRQRLSFKAALEARRAANLGHKHQRAWIVDEGGRLVRCLKRDPRRFFDQRALRAAA